MYIYYINKLNIKINLSSMKVCAPERPAPFCIAHISMYYSCSCSICTYAKAQLSTTFVFNTKRIKY